MPYFDHAQYLTAAVNSVAALNYPEIELIIIDDCSPEPHAEDLAGNHPFKNLRFAKHSTNKGHVAAKNTGIREAKGDFILPLDSDDLLQADFLEKTMPLMSDKAVGIVLTDVEVFGDQEYIYSPAMTKLDFAKLRTASNTFLVRRELFDKIGSYDETLLFGDESDFSLRALEMGWKIAHLPEALYRYRRHPAGMSYQVSYVKLLESMIMRHRGTFDEHLAEILLYQEKRYWNEIDAADLGEGEGTKTDDVNVIKRQYQHLHTEFHKLLRDHERISKELDQATQQRDKLASGRYYRIRNFLHRMKLDGSGFNSNAIPAKED